MDAGGTQQVAPSGGRSQLQVRQRTRKRQILLMSLLCLPALFFSASAWPETGLVVFMIEDTGAFLIIVAVFGRTWCTLYIGGRKRVELVTSGPYSIVRHPLYLFSLIGLAGIGAQTGSLLIAVAVPLLFSWPLASVARHEEDVLSERFGQQHASYVARVPAFIPRPLLWKDEAILDVRPRLVRRTFLEACLLLLAIPVAEVVQSMQVRGLMPVGLRLH